MKPITLRTVAQQARVSIATVSKVVNGINKGISPETVARVQRIILELNYRPNRTGRQLRTQRNYIVGMAIVDDSPTFLTDPFITQLVAGLSNFLGKHNYGLLLHGIAPESFEQSFLLKESVVDALCLMLSGPNASRRHFLDVVHASGHPMVVFQEKPRRSLTDCCFVNQDDQGGAEALALKIVARNPQQAFILVPELQWHAIDARVKGLCTVLDKHKCNYQIISSDENQRQSTLKALDTAMATHGLPDVVIGTNDRLAYVAYRYFIDAGHRIPEDIGITGFNAFDADATLNPALESVQSPAYALGEAGGKALLSRLDTGSFESASLTLPVSPVRGTTLS
ncbi:LacI family DNA-binding transcriptional regulator [Advenella mimigardefordensis]|uniref:Transcriptional regulator, LacI family n=1 Tax=Advenella mimigardefordensis (strain DSM 17166 / LMG 22922 / DPN7) TaxID=1247726 RepID=W0PG56_ADVMD|nr:LacI family DNA-binding transcriptional regulator [Advenella mimigardefordensis]AHG64063.1 transcriptional regulator, LacI family [Advenella mimigardefordensis DPN7]